MSDTLTRIKQAYSIGRIAIGTAAVVAPGPIGKAFGVELDAGGQLIMRMFGSRDAILGVGQLLGEKHGAARGFYEAAAAVDLADAVVFGTAFAAGNLSKSKAIAGIAVAGLAAVAGVAFARMGGSDDLDAELKALTEEAAAGV